MLSTISRTAATVTNDSATYCRTKNTLNLHYHFVFRTQINVISADWRERFYRFLKNCVAATEAEFVGISGTNQSVVFRVRLPLTLSPDEFAQRLKILSAVWLRRTAGQENFAWNKIHEAILLDSKRMSSSSLHRRALVN